MTGTSPNGARERPGWATLPAHWNRVFDGLAAVACAVALWTAVQNVAGLRWPYDGDHFRDVAQAQSTLDGHPLSDPFYKGEWIWYNPLLPWLVALGSAATRLTPAEFHVQGGPWVNLLAPAAFYLLAARLAGRGSAFAAVIIYLFLTGRTEPSLAAPTYSPWLFVATFAQGVFYLSVIVLLWAADRQTAATAVILGLFAGLTFLAHTAPALILVVVALKVMAPRWLAVAGVTALVTASPFLYAIVGHYHLRVVNEAPQAWRYLPVTLAGLPELLPAHTMLLLAGAAGAVMLRQAALWAWLAAALGLMLYGLMRDLAPALPAVVPTFHFWRYTVAVLTICAGASVWRLSVRLAGRRAVALLIASALTTVWLYYPRYRSRFDFVYGRAIAEQRDPNLDLMVRFLHKSIPEDAVVLGSRGAALLVIGPAGRRTVAVNANWSNPYVDNANRVRDREEMFIALKAGDQERFTSLASRYELTHVMAVGDQECRAVSGPALRPVYRFGEVCLFLLAGPEL